MHRDLVEQRRWITEDTYKLSLALAQMPGPLAAQVATAIGYFEEGVLGATFAGLAFVLPSFLMVVGISLAYVAYGGLWWMQALFYAIGATVIAIIAIAAYKLARSTNGRDPLLWGYIRAAYGGDGVGPGRAGGVLYSCGAGGSPYSGVARLET
ncbi:MAG: chromate transporter, partial [Candidatus Binatia bacterium]